MIYKLRIDEKHTYTQKYGERSHNVINIEIKKRSQ